MAIKILRFTPILKRMIIFKFLIFFMLGAIPVFSQETGSINGKVIDAITGEPIIGVAVVVKGTRRYGLTDINGNYSIQGVSFGKHSLMFNMMGYRRIVINIKVNQGAGAKVNTALPIKTTGEIVVTGKRITGTAAALLNKRKKAAVAQDTISAEEIKKSPDSDAADAAKRVTGVSMLDGKYIFIRGLSERYSNITVNGMQVPSPLPSRKVVPLNIFPINLMDNIIISKSSLPNMSSDSTAGTVTLNTRDFPEKSELTASIGLSYNTRATFKDFYGTEGGKFDFFGFDDGTRDMPGSIPSNRRASTSVTTSTEKDRQAEDFNNNYIPKSEKGIPGGKAGFSYGDTFKFGGKKSLGLLFSFLFKESSESIKGAREVRYQTSNDESTDITYDRSTYSTTLSSQLSLSFSLSGKDIFKYIGFYTHQSSDSVKVKSGKISVGQGTGVQNIISYQETELFFNQLMGEHIFDTITPNNKFVWKASYSVTKRKQPDVATIFYDVNGQVDTTNPMSKYFNEHIETAYQIIPEYLFQFRQWNGLYSKLTIGGDFSARKRKNEGRRFLIQFQDTLHINNITEDPATIFNTNDMVVREITGDTLATGLDSYEGSTYISSGYGMLDIFLTNKLRLIGGVRYEVWQQKVSAYSVLNRKMKYITGISGSEILPSSNLVLTVGKNTNFRLGYSRTINRPEYVEMGNYYYYDQLETGFIIQGNPGLKKATIDNYDFRMEYYPGTGEILALSIFFKDIDRPIEATVKIADDPSFTFNNQKRAIVYGAEAEIKKDFGFITKSLKSLKFISNFTYSISEIELDEDLGSAETNSKRSLQGQSPIIMNLGLGYEIKSTGTDFTILYNVFSRRIVFVGVNGLENIYEEPFHQLDLTISQKIFEAGKLKLAFENLLDYEVEQNQGTGNDKKLIRKYKKGVKISFSYSQVF